MNIFAAQFLNSIMGTNASGSVLAGLGGGTDGQNSPFAMLLSGDAAASATPTGTKPVSGLLQNNKGFATLDEEGNGIDLKTAETLMSELMGANWQALQSGDTLTLASGWTLTAGANDTLSLANPDGQVMFPSFTKDQLQGLLDAYADAGSSLPFDFDGDKTEDEIADEAAVKEKTKDAQFKEKVHVDTQIEKTAVINNSVKAAVTADAVMANAASSTDATASAAATTSGDDAASGNPLQPLWDALKNAQQRDAYLSAPVSVYASAGASRGIISASNNNAPVITAASLGIHSLASATTQKVSPVLAELDEMSFSLSENTDATLALDAADNASVPLMMQQQGIRVSNDGNLQGTQPLAPAQLNLIIQKMAERGDARTLTVRLDPPELGRIQISLTSGSDKMVKAHIMVEKPEALSLLKRDMASLEKTLHDAGLSLDGDSVTMDLASDGNGQNGFAQQAFMEMWSDNQNNSAFGKTGAELATENNVAAVNVADTEEFYQSDTAVNIKI